MKFRILAILLLFLLIACQTKKSEYKKISGFAQGTTYSITYENSTKTDFSQSVDSILKAFDQSLSIYDSTSIISRVNANDTTVRVDDWFAEVFNKSAEVCKHSEGAFDITVGPVVNAWGFGNGPIAKHDTAQIVELLKYVGMDKISLAGKKVLKQSPEVKIDVNAIAQGYSVDIVCRYLDKKGIKNYLVEIGGEVKGQGTNPKNQPWRIGIDKPIDGNMAPGNDLQAVVEIKNKALATSGNYRAFYVENGVKYAHTIDPKTGFPARNTLLSATVVCDDCMTADAYATAFMVLGFEKSKKMLGKLPQLDVYFIHNDENGNYQIFLSEGMKKMIAE